MIGIKVNKMRNSPASLTMPISNFTIQRNKMVSLLPSDLTLYQQTKIEGLDASRFRIRSCGEHCDFEQPESIINLKPLTQQFRFNHIPKAAK